MIHLKRLAGPLLLLSLALTGCTSLSPQQVELQPRIDTRQRLPNGLQVELDARDLRKSPVLGYRVSHFEQNAFLTLARDARYSLLSSAHQALRQMGVYRFGAVAGNPGGLKLTLLLDRLSYDASQHTTQQQVLMQMELRLVADYRGRTFTGRYQSQKEYRSPLPPSEAKNQTLLNELAGDTLTRAFNDPKLLDFIRRGG
ncbi:YajG family lipoprotein [Marinobacterium aestuariivivens]|uniref:YajG family lipoprotein n=1 Tax=Marinobacterium aestuariivivens TaxID=1698799 RepID=A0ABW1ZU55_9GAMM